MSHIRVVLADDHTIVRKGLRVLLEEEIDIEVVGEAEDGRECIKLVSDLRPDVVLMDISMPLMNGLECTKQIKKQYPAVKVLVLTMHTHDEYISEVLHAGASGYVVKKTAPVELIRAIRAVHSDDVYLSPSVSKKIVASYLQQASPERTDDPFKKLTDREREIMQLVAEGHSNKKIASDLSISIKTVESHRSKIMEKLNLHGTADLTRYAISRGIISPDL